MQFTGHSLPVHQSMSVSWDFTLSNFIRQARHRIVSVPSGASLWNGMFSQVEGQYITTLLYMLCYDSIESKVQSQVESFQRL